MTESAKPAGEAAWSIATSLMTSIATTVIVIGILFAIAGWLASPTGSARATRRTIAPVLRHHVAYVYTGLAIIVCLYFLSGPTQGLRTFLTTLIVAGMAAFGIHELRKQTEEEFPDAELQRRLRPHPRQGRQRRQGRQHRRAGWRAGLETAAAGEAAERRERRPARHRPR